MKECSVQKGYDSCVDCNLVGQELIVTEKPPLFTHFFPGGECEVGSMNVNASPELVAMIARAIQGKPRPFSSENGKKTNENRRQANDLMKDVLVELGIVGEMRFVAPSMGRPRRDDRRPERVENTTGVELRSILDGE